MNSKIRSKKSSKAKSLRSGAKSIQNSNCKQTHLESTCISGSQYRQNKTNSKQSNSNYDLSNKKAKQNIYSQCRSEASFAKSDKKSIAAKSAYHEKQSLIRLLQNSTCQKHQPWFNCNDQYPLKPEIKVEMPQDIYPEQNWQKSKEQKFQRLIEDMRKKHMARFQEKISKEKSQIEKTCPFIPNNLKVMKEEHNPEIHESLFQRFKEVQEKQKQFEQQKIMQQKQILEKYEHQKKTRHEQNKRKWQKFLNTETNKHDYDKPIHQRLDFIKDGKKELIEQLKMKYSPTQTPLKNQKLSPQKCQELIKRLCDDYRIKKKQYEAEVEQTIKDQMKLICPFTPIVNQTDLYRYRGSPQNNQISPKKTNQKFTFHPKIDDMSKVIAQKIQSKISSNDQNYLSFPERLYGPNLQQKMMKLNHIQKEVYQECTFQPEINQISKELIFVKNYQGEALNVHKCPLPQTVIELQKQLTFKPQINSQSKCMTWFQKQEVVIKKKEKSKERLEKIENNKQYKEMEECTFQPKTVSTSVDWKKWKESNLKKEKMKFFPVGDTIVYSDRENPQHCETVKGLSKFLKNCEKIKRKKQSHAQRLNKIFNFEQKYDERMKKQRFGPDN